MDILPKFATIVVIGICLGLGAFVGTIIKANLEQKYFCKGYAEALNLQHEYSRHTGCTFKVNNITVRLEDIR